MADIEKQCVFLFAITPPSTVLETAEALVRLRSEGRTAHVHGTPPLGIQEANQCSNLKKKEKKQKIISNK